MAGRAPRVSVPYTITVDTSLDRHAIIPLIYGMAGAGQEYLKDLRLGANRWGGNPNSRYNWERGNCWNAARDWEFRNTNYQASDSIARQLVDAPPTAEPSKAPPRPPKSTPASHSTATPSG